MEVILAIATVIGGISAIWYFIELYISRKSSVDVNFSVSSLDGYSSLDNILEHNFVYIKGVKFNITIKNKLNKTVLLNKILISKHVLDKKTSSIKKSLRGMNFKAPMVPHQLFIIVDKKFDKVWWNIANGIKLTRYPVCAGSDNLLNLCENKNFEFHIKAGEIEVIEGVLALNEPILMGINFTFHFIDIENECIKVNTSEIFIGQG